MRTTVAEKLAQARLVAFHILTKHPDCLRDDVPLNELVEDIAVAIAEKPVLTSGEPTIAMADENAKLRATLHQIANYGQETNEWDAVERYEIVRNMAHGTLAETDPSRPKPVRTSGE